MNHPNVVLIKDFGEDASYVYIVMEFCPGGQLLDLITRRSEGKARAKRASASSPRSRQKWAHGGEEAFDFYTELEACDIVRTVAGALRYCHSKGIVHRDLKPENLLLTEAPGPDGSRGGKSVIKLADFGFAAVDRGAGESLERRCGSPAYVAPEILFGRRYGAKVDVWSLGVIAFALLTGCLPFGADDGTSAARKTLYARIKRADFDFREHPHVSKRARRFLRRLLVVDPRERVSIEEALQLPWLRDGVEGGQLKRAKGRVTCKALRELASGSSARFVL